MGSIVEGNLGAVHSLFGALLVGGGVAWWRALDSWMTTQSISAVMPVRPVCESTAMVPQYGDDGPLLPSVAFVSMRHSSGTECNYATYDTELVAIICVSVSVSVCECMCECVCV